MMNKELYYNLTSTGKNFNFKKGHSCVIKNFQFNTLIHSNTILSKEIKKEYNPKFIQEILETEKEESISITSYDDLFS